MQVHDKHQLKTLNTASLHTAFPPCHPGPRAGTHTVIATNRESRAYRDLIMGPGSPLRSARDDSERKPIG